MRWWHQAHFPFWGKQDLLDRANAFYLDLLENATSLAQFQGYAGARWQKMLGLANPLNRASSFDFLIRSPIRPQKKDLPTCFFCQIYKNLCILY
jgi:hypothetical protein